MYSYLANLAALFLSLLNLPYNCTVKLTLENLHEVRVVKMGSNTGWRKCTECLQLQVILHESGAGLFRGECYRP